MDLNIFNFLGILNLLNTHWSRTPWSLLSLNFFLVFIDIHHLFHLVDNLRNFLTLLKINELIILRYLDWWLLQVNQHFILFTIRLWLLLNSTISLKESITLFLTIFIQISLFQNSIILFVLLKRVESINHQKSLSLTQLHNSLWSSPLSYCSLWPFFLFNCMRQLKLFNFFHFLFI